MKYSMVAASVLLFSAQLSHAADSKNINLKLGVNGGGFGIGPAVEYRVNNHITASALVEMLSLSDGSTTASSTAYGFGVRHYFSEALTQNTYVNLAFITGTVEASNNVDMVKIDASSFILTYGKTWMWDSFNLDASVGLRSITINDSDSAGTVDTSSINDLAGVGPAIGLSFGFAF